MAGQKPNYGQVLVIVAIGLLALVAFVALATDVGGLYQQRRAMQNAADAGALAGAREVCFGSGTEEAARSVAWDYAVTRNSADGAVITVTLPTTVTVVATRTYQTFFAGILGFREMPVQADATAVCGKAEAVGNLWPVGFDKDRWLQARDDMECGDRVIIWQGSNQINCGNPTDGGLNCCTLYKNDNKNHVEVLEYLDCYPNYVPKMYPLDRASWVDFTAGLTGEDPCDGGTGVGADEIKYRIRGENNKGEECTPFLTIPDCYAGGTGSGVATSGWLEASKIDDGRIVHIPLYDPYASGKNVPGTITIAEEAGVSDPSDIYNVCEITDSRSGGNEAYYIDALMCLQIGVYHEDDHTWWTTGYLREFPDENGVAKFSDPVIVASVPCDEDGNSPPECFTNPGYTTGTPAQPGDIKAVSLVD